MHDTHETSAVVAQTRLGNGGFLALLSFLSAFIPMSTDLYLPALPKMAESLGAPISLVNLTLTLFFVFYAVSALFWGPLSDRYGRKPILLAGLILYIAASVGCALSANVVQLIVLRAAQAIGSGAVSAVATAAAKDTYEGRKLETTLSVVQSMAMIAPIVAPVLGGIILRFTSWRGVFIALAVLGALALAAALLMNETLAVRGHGNLFSSLGRLSVVLKNKTFVLLVVTFSLVAIPFLAFISVSSYIFVEGFGVSEQVYSYYFAFNALFLVISPLAYIRLSKRFSGSSVITACFVMMGIGGLLLCTVGSLSPWAFTLSILPASIAGGLMRPPTSKMMLDQVQADIGSASAVMSFVFTILGAVGMTLVAFDWPNRILFIGAVYLVVAAFSLALWLLFGRPRVKAQP